MPDGERAQHGQEQRRADHGAQRVRVAERVLLIVLLDDRLHDEERDERRDQHRDERHGAEHAELGPQHRQPLRHGHEARADHAGEYSPVITSTPSTPIASWARW